MTRDHSQVEELVEQGVIQREQAEEHPSANVITRAVGGSDELYLDVDMRTLESGDRLLLCSDGLYKDVTVDEMRDIMAEGTCSDVARNLVNKALERDCNDNVTVIVVDFDEARE